jgi:hypothetical protein
VLAASIINALMMEAASTLETSVKFYQTIRYYNPEDSHLHTRRLENLKSYLVIKIGRKDVNFMGLAHNRVKRRQCDNDNEISAPITTLNFSTS